MIYTTHGLMTPADMAEYRADYDLDLCPDCEAGTGCDVHGDDEEEGEGS